MDELSTTSVQLPDKLEDLAKFALIGREKLKAVKAEIRAIEEVGLAKEVHEQKLIEAQEIAEAVLDAEVKIGELTAKIPKATPNNNPFHEIRNGAELVKPKSEQLSEIGIKQDTAERFERLAKHPDLVKQAKEEARQNDRIVTRQNVLDMIVPPRTKAQTMREFKKQAREEHKEFKEDSSGTVSIADIKNDKKNLEIIALDIETTISKALDSVTAIQFLKANEISIMLDQIDSEAKRKMISKIDVCVKVLLHLKGDIERSLNEK